MDEVAVDARGLVGDRLYAVRDAEASSARARTRAGSGACRDCYSCGPGTPGKQLQRFLRCWTRTACPYWIPPPTCGVIWAGTTSKWLARAQSRISTSSHSAS
ncbi:hypothetical protein [Streptomyces swartbergensis]|uniref:hypothetical protein n=1 Tax=Streptomyces swartbergensis TaxID=487165 RepID=UPI00382220E9